MPTVIPVKFKYASRELWFDPGETGAQEADHVICATERGSEVGLACADAREVSPEELHATIGESALRKVVRIATDDDLERAERLAEQSEEALPTFRRLVHESGLDMKPVGVEYLFGGEKVVCYFSAEERVDFRQLVRDLSHALHERIDMRQIGVREEAAIVGGFGHCGQELCCTRFGRQFEPVSIRMAKEQDLPLNNSKISGACGRLMCCLRYEFEAYRDFKGRAPKRNAVIDTPLGKAKIVEYDTPKEQICLRLENGKQIRVPLADMEASPAAKKKSEELGCACRPDTVTRAALERLQSPDVQMALAELDRKMGKVEVESFDESDIFVDQRPRHRRARKASHEAPVEERAQRAQETPAEGNEQGLQAPRRRRRRKAQGAAMPPAPAGKAQQGEASDGAQPSSEAAPAPARHRRRRHHSAPLTNNEIAGSERAGGQQPRVTERKAPESGASSGRRRPGDRGGQGGFAQGHAAHGSSPATGPSEGKPRRRRRHHGGSGPAAGMQTTPPGEG